MHGLEVAEGEQITFEVEANTSTGFVLTFNEDAADGHFTATSVYVDDSDEGMLGAGGYEFFTLTGLQEGESEFRLDSFGPDGTEGLSTSFDVTVTAANDE